MSFKIGIDYGDDSLKARQLIKAAAGEIEYVLPDPPPAVNMAAMADQYVQLEVSFWIDTFTKGINMIKVKNEVMERCRLTLADNGFTFSSNVSTNVDLTRYGSIKVDWDKQLD